MFFKNKNLDETKAIAMVRAMREYAGYEFKVLRALKTLVKCNLSKTAEALQLANEYLELEVIRIMAIDHPGNLPTDAGLLAKFPTCKSKFLDALRMKRLSLEQK